MARLLAVPGRLLGWLGCSGGAVLTELFPQEGPARQAALLARHDGQRMAALPCALVARALSAGRGSPSGALTAYEFLGSKTLLRGLTSEGFELVNGEHSDHSRKTNR